MKPFEVSFEYMDQLSDYIIAGSSIVIQETVGQGCMTIFSIINVK